MKKKRPPTPIFSSGLIETHCHLDSIKHTSEQDLLDQAAAVGVDKILTIAVSATNLADVRRMAARYAVVYGSQGIHPHEATGYNENVEREIVDNLTQEKIVAVGEIGLDYYYDHAERKIQREVFARQLQIAVEQDYPVIIHSREADADTQAILEDFAGRLKGVIHSFTSGIELAEYSLGIGLLLGFNGIVTFKNAENVRDVLRITPLEKILLETDAPYLTPVPWRGRENEPALLPFVAASVAKVKEQAALTLVEQANRNARDLFGF